MVGEIQFEILICCHQQTSKTNTTRTRTMTLFGNDPATTGVLVTARTGRAFVLVLAAAGATALGSCSVFYPSLAQWATADVLAASLGFASGVMLYVSLVDIYTKSMTGFQDQGYTADQAFCYTTFSFFAGILLMKVRVVCCSRFAKESWWRFRSLTRFGLTMMMMVLCSCPYHTNAASSCPCPVFFQFHIGH